MNELFIEAKYIISGSKCNRIIKNGGILIENDEIVAIGKVEPVKSLVSGHDKLDRTNHIVIPSLVNSHTHIPETLLRGICDDEKLMTWLNDYIWPFERRMTSEDAYYGTLLGCLELIESGVSGFIDQYFYAESIKKAAKEAKIRALICPSVFDNTPESGSLENTWKHVSSLLNNSIPDTNQLVNYGIGPHAPYTVPEEYLYKVKELAAKNSLSIHIHLNETKSEVEQSLKDFGMSPIEYIHKLGLTEEKILAAHCVNTQNKDWKIMKESNITVLHNPQSNLKMTSGIAPIYKYLELGINVAVGTDGNASNNDLGMIEELSTAAMLQKHLSQNPKVLDNSQALRLGTINGMKALGVQSQGITEKSKADLTILSLEKSHSWPQNNIVSNIIYSSSSSDVSDLIINGKLVYFNKEHQTLNKEKIIEKCSTISERIITEMGKIKK
ncbi:MAG: amidohydrolase [Candidatus Heimdallarchaeota archaeon]|nr:amidohydrolase [Candidatus Heimdallarchaeota archaeon]